MRTGVVIAFVIGLLLGATGMHIFGTSASRPAAEELTADARSPTGETGAPMLETQGQEVIAGLRSELVTARERIATLEARPSAAKATEGRVAQTAAVPAAKGRAKKKMPDAVWSMAEQVGASRAAVDAAWRLRQGDYEDREAAVAQLKAFGEDGLLAVATLSLTPGAGHTMLAGLVGELGVPGGDDILIRLLEGHEQTGGLVSALREYDTKHSRDFLVERLGSTADDPGQFWLTAVALGHLKEPRGAEEVRIEALARPRWGGVRGHILYALGQMGGPQAARRLSDYLAMPGADHLGTAANALAVIDEEAARRHARRILAGERAFLSWQDRRALETLAQEEED